MSKLIIQNGFQVTATRLTGTLGQYQEAKPMQRAAANTRQPRLRVSSAIAEPKANVPLAKAAEKLSLSELTAVGPLDGRYGSKVAGLRNSCSEYGLIKARALVEIRWLQMLSQLPEVSATYTKLDVFY